MRLPFLLAFALGAALLSAARAQTSGEDEFPPLPVGLDAYRMWDRWPEQRIGQRTYMRSTYDRGGGNRDADASNFLFQLSDDSNVTLDVEGQGLVSFIRYNHWHGSPWHYFIDGAEHVLRESMTENPHAKIQKTVFIPNTSFFEPFAYTWATTKGADLIWMPMEFEKSFRMSYERTHYGTGYYIYSLFAPGTKLSSPIHAWDGKAAPQQDVVDLINRAGQDLLPAIGAAEERAMSLTSEAGQVSIPKDGAISVTPSLKGPSAIRAIQFSVRAEDAEAFGRAHVRVIWDDRSAPSIDAPVALFFGAGTLYNRAKSEYLVKAFPVKIHFVGERVLLACYFPMPFFKSAQIELVGNGETPITDVQWTIRQVPFDEPASHVGFFHATYRDHGVPVLGKDLVLLDTREQEGNAEWSGSLVGTSFIFSDKADLRTLEGDPRFFFDDSQTPQAQGTGTEEWGGGGDYWGGATMTLPFAGHPVGAKNPKDAHNAEDQIESAYRFLLADLMPFGKNARIQMEHGGEDDSKEHYRTITYWYGLPAPSLVKTDSLKVGDPASEKEHQYVSPDASEPYSITSRYEVGVDHAGGVVVVPTETDSGRKTTGTSEFQLKIDPANLGVLLRRKLDYAFPNQRAIVSIADASEPASGANWKPAGVWYLAGSNTCVSSNPKEELGATQHNIRTSNRRFRDDEFLLPVDLTKGRAAIRVRVTFTPVHIPLFPGQPEAELAWSEIRYDAYSYVVPRFAVESK